MKLNMYVPAYTIIYTLVIQDSWDVNNFYYRCIIV